MLITPSDAPTLTFIIFIIYGIYIVIVIAASYNILTTETATVKAGIVTLFFMAIPIFVVYFSVFASTKAYFFSYIVFVLILSYLVDGTKTRIGWIFTLLVIVVPVTWALVNIGLHQIQRHKKSIVRKKISIKREENFKQLCAQESYFNIKRKIPKQSIVTIKPLKALRPKFNKSCSQKFEKYGVEWQDCSDHSASPIRWNKYNLRRYAEQYGKANIEIETRRMIDPQWKSKFFSDYSKDEPIYQINAPKHWWLQTGLDDIVKQITHFDTAEYDKRFSLSLIQSLSSYQIETRSISKITDVENGVRRFKISLTDKSNEEVIAEYIGFDSSYRSTGSTDNATLSEINCVTLELDEPLHHRSKSDDRPGDHPPEEKVFKYFFERVVDYAQTQPTPRIQHYP